MCGRIRLDIVSTGAAVDVLIHRGGQPNVSPNFFVASVRYWAFLATCLKYLPEILA
jgi:hypothetical protein